MGSKKTRITLDLNPKQYALLCKLADEAGVTKAQVLRTALILADYVEKMENQGCRIKGHYPDGKVEEVLIIWTLGAVATGQGV